MLVVIPTFKRNACLRAVLQSLVQCKIDGVGETVRVVVVNNYPPAKEEIGAIVSEFLHVKRFQWDVLYREKTLPPIENWYSAIFARALPDEVVVLNGDDDLLLSWGLQERFAEIERLRADLLLAEIAGELFFCKGATRAYCTTRAIDTGEDRAVTLDMGTVHLFAPQHVSNHCFRNTATFRAAYGRAMAWCKAQEWLDENTRTLFLPLYIPFAILLCGGRVGGLRRPCFLRGRDVEEIAEARFGVPACNHGFAHLCALGVLENGDLGPISELEPLRVQYREEFARWFLTCLWDARVGRSALGETLRRTNFQTSELYSLKTLQGIGLVALELLHLKGFRLRQRCKRHSVAMDEFMRTLG